MHLQAQVFAQFPAPASKHPPARGLRTSALAAAAGRRPDQTSLPRPGKIQGAHDLGGLGRQGAEAESTGVLGVNESTGVLRVTGASYHAQRRAHTLSAHSSRALEDDHDGSRVDFTTKGLLTIASGVGAAGSGCQSREAPKEQEGQTDGRRDHGQRLQEGQTEGRRDGAGAFTPPLQRLQEKEGSDACGAGETGERPPDVASEIVQKRRVLFQVC